VGRDFIAEVKIYINYNYIDYSVSKPGGESRFLLISVIAETINLVLAFAHPTIYFGDPRFLNIPAQ